MKSVRKNENKKGGRKKCRIRIPSRKSLRRDRRLKVRGRMLCRLVGNMCVRTMASVDVRG